MCGCAGPLEGEQGEQELQMKLSELHSMIYLQVCVCVCVCVCVGGGGGGGVVGVSV